MNQVGAMDNRAKTDRAGPEKTAIIQRLSRIEGQVRGLKQMAEGDRATVEQIQQVNAVMAALREVALLSIAREVQSQIFTMAGETPPSEDVQRLIELLRTSFRLT